MTRVFSGSSPNLKEFSWIQAKEEAVNAKKDDNIPKHQKRESKDLEIKRVYLLKKKKF